MKAKGTKISGKLDKNNDLELNLAKEVALPEIIHGESLASYPSRNSLYNPKSLSPQMTLNNLGNYERPFSVYNNSYLSAQEPISLCQKAYDRIPQFRTSIDILTDITNTKIHFKGGNLQSKKFFEAWWNQIRGENLKRQFFREVYRSGNVIFERIDAILDPTDVFKINNLYASEASISIPSRYILLDAAKLCVESLTSDASVYYRIISKFELNQLKNSSTEGDKQTYKSILEAVEGYAKKGNTDPVIKLDPTKIHAVFYCKQDYEPFAIPMGYCVIDDINLKMEFRKADMVAARAVEQIILLVTTGEPEDKGGINPKIIEALKAQFRNEKVGRVLVSDYTTKLQFIVPQISEIINPSKYDDINSNIANGLYNIFFGEQKFADSVNKLRALVQKIENVQDLFINDFLNTEIKRISKEMNFKAYPKVVMEPVRIEDQSNMFRVYAQLLQLGVLSPRDGIELMDTGILPNYDDVYTNQGEYKSDKDKGYFQPMQGGPHSAKELAKIGAASKAAKAAGLSANKGGRPQGTKAPQKTKKVSQTGASEIDEIYDSKAFAHNFILLNNTRDAFISKYKVKNNVDRLSKKNKQSMEFLFSALVENETPDRWEKVIDNYLDPEFVTSKGLPENMHQITYIQSEFGMDRDGAISLFYSQIPTPTEDNDKCQS